VPKNIEKLTSPKIKEFDNLKTFGNPSDMYFRDHPSYMKSGYKSDLHFTQIAGQANQFRTEPTSKLNNHNVGKVKEFGLPNN
jgi:hypothetical protein